MRAPRPVARFAANSAFADPHVRATAPELDGDRERILKDLVDEEDERR